MMTPQAEALKSPHQKRVEEFLRRFGKKLPDKVSIPSEDDVDLLIRLLNEEHDETISALCNLKKDEPTTDQLAEVLDGLIDLSVIIQNAMAYFGFIDTIALEEVDNNNLAKVWTIEQINSMDYDIGEHKIENVTLANDPSHDRTRFIVTRRSDGKIIKPPNHPKPNLKSCLARMITLQTTQP